VTRRDQRARATGRLGMLRGERYALIPREVLESEAYRAVPDWCVRVLVALAAQYYSGRGGSLALPVSDAQRLGVRQPWRVYAGLRILEAANLITCTRRGHLASAPLANLFALTWRPVDEPATGVTYDAGISVSPMATHAWARWQRPADWDAYIARTIESARGPSGARRAARADTCPSGTDRTPQSGTERTNTVPPSQVRRARSAVPPSRVTSEISAPGRRGIRLLSPSLPAPNPIPSPSSPAAPLRMLLLHGHSFSAEQQTASLACWLLARAPAPARTAA
jgi:hypothetical protein